MWTGCWRRGRLRRGRVVPAATGCADCFIALVVLNIGKNRLEFRERSNQQSALSVAYGAGLRVAEIAALKVSDIDSKRMLVRVEQGKRRKDRYAVLSPKMLELLRDWWRIARPKLWLFPGQDPTKPQYNDVGEISGNAIQLVEPGLHAA